MNFHKLEDNRKEITYNRYFKVIILNDLARRSYRKTQFWFKASQGSNSLSMELPRNGGTRPRVCLI